MAYDRADFRCFLRNSYYGNAWFDRFLSQYHKFWWFFREEWFKYVLRRIGISYQGLSYQKYFEYATKIVMIEAVIFGFFETENVSS